MSDDELDLTPLGESVELLEKGDRDGALRRLVNFAVSFWSGIPGVGKLTEEVATALEGITSQGKLRRALRELAAEDDETKRRKALAAAVVETLKDTIHGQELADEAREVALQAIQARKVALDAAIEAGAVRVHQRLVANGAAGVVVARGATRAVDVAQETVTGPGTTGVKLE